MTYCKPTLSLLGLGSATACCTSGCKSESGTSPSSGPILCASIAFIPGGFSYSAGTGASCTQSAF